LVYFKKSSPLKLLGQMNRNLFGQAVLEEKLFMKSANQKQELPMAAMFVH
jgi:hypothetical protein